MDWHQIDLIPTKDLMDLDSHNHSISSIKDLLLCIIMNSPLQETIINSFQRLIGDSWAHLLVKDTVFNIATPKSLLSLMILHWNAVFCNILPRESRVVLQNIISFLGQKEVSLKETLSFACNLRTIFWQLGLCETSSQLDQIISRLKCMNPIID